VTTIVDMPLNSVPATTSVHALQAKVAAAVAQSHVDVGFWGGVVPGNDAQLDGLVDAGVRGFKCFLVPSGVDEFPAVGEADLRRALPVLARRRMPLLVHAELPSCAAAGGVGSGECAVAAGGSPASAHLHPQPYGTYLATRPPVMEREAIRLMIRLAAEFGVPIHIVHVSSAEGVEAIAAAKAGRVPVTAETCPHYLTFASGEIPDGATEFKCAPPIRSASHRDALWDGLASGALDLVASDHSPSLPAMKTPGDFTRAWGGIPSLELSLAAVWTGARSRGAAAIDLARWLSAAPAALAGLSHRKGRLEAGLDADLVVWDPDASFVVHPERLQQRHKATPYAGRRLFGVVHTTFVRGGRVWERQRLARAHGGTLL
jgi:allantoinase